MDGLFVVLNAGEFKACVSPKTPKSSELISPVRYFYFTLPDFLNVRKLFLISLNFFDLYAKIPHRSAGFLSASFLSMQVGTGEGIRTPDLLVRSQSLYPTELRPHTVKEVFLSTAQLV